MKSIDLKVLFCLCLFSFPCTAQERAVVAALDEASLDDNAVAIYGTGCEKIKDNELKSSVRLRATDKANFMAVSTLSALSDFKSKTNEHDFNVLVYNLVDNYVEDMAVRTTKQNQEEICVEVTGYIQKDNIKNQLSNPRTSAADNSENEESDAVSAQEDEEISTLEKVKPIDAPPAYTPEQNNPPHNEKRALVYVANTQFFDNTSSATHAQILKDLYKGNEYFYITPQKSLADYIVSSKVLRAKVDPINSNTNRLQMVISVEVENMETRSSTIEHQNRFVLFSNDEEEQEVAFKLMKKLFEKAGEQIEQKIEQTERKKKNFQSLPKIITPISSPHAPETNAH